MWIEKEITIGEVDQLLKDGYEIEVDSPDGWVGVNFFINKGLYPEYVLQMEDQYEYPNVRCNADHLFETTVGWVSASQLCDKGEVNILTKDGYKKGQVFQTGLNIPIVDINVEHKNHRYYTEGVSSHNTGVGKSLFMCHVAAASLIQAHNVLYVTMEMAEERIAERIDANLLNVPVDQLKNLNKDIFSTKIQNLSTKTTGKLIIKEYPTGQAHSGHFRALLSELKLKKKFVPDIMFIDYLNICSSARMKGMGGAINSYNYIKAIAEEIRGLAVEFDVPIVSATQTTRSGYSNTDVGLEDTSECVCVTEKIRLRDGTEKEIGNVQFGDQIESNDGYKTVMKVHHKKIKPCVKLTLKSGKTIIVSKDHVFPTNRGRFSINTGLDIGDKLNTKNYSLVG